MVAVICSFIGKFAMSMNYSLLYLYTGELYPTSCRSLGFTICTAVGRISSIGLPFIVDGKLTLTT